MNKKRLTAYDVITSSGSYPDRLKSPELTKPVLDNVDKLVKLVNELLDHIKWDKPIVVSSGFRPSAVNASVPNAAAKSSHTLGMAVDIMQPKDNNELAKVIIEAQKKDKILTKLGLWIENPQFTVGKNTSWVHLDFRTRPDRDSRMFNP